MLACTMCKIHLAVRSRGNQCMIGNHLAVLDLSPLHCAERHLEPTPQCIALGCALCRLILPGAVLGVCQLNTEAKASLSILPSHPFAGL